ncbi:DUF6064 family protein [Dongia deserti]|uniref:DUF6064 family protein n=1 Tax=Dongia deserti TaxID=2268030 RepID=UPI000E64F101|nr:DUF6064 family protein [Dongia deserti]
MSEWWGYRLSDFLLFSPRAYWRLLELHNEALWPLPLLTLAAGLLAGGLALLRPKAASRVIPLLLAVLWAWVAWSFFWNRYATINWAAIYVAPIFALQAMLLFVLGGPRQVDPDGRGWWRAIVVTLLAVALLYPLLAPLSGRPWSQAEIFGMAPDPTATGTLALLLLTRARWCVLLFPIPVLWCLASGITLGAMDASLAWVPPFAALAACALAIAQPRKAARPRV